MEDKSDNEYPSSKIEDLEDMEIAERSVALDDLKEVEIIYEALAEELAKIRNRDQELEWAHVLTQRERTLILEYFVISSAVIERLSTMTLFEFVIPEEEKVRKGGESEPGKEFFKSNLNQNRRERLLFECGIIDSGLKGELAKVRQIRNELVHDVFQRRLLEETEEIESDVDRALRAVNKLDEIHQELLSQNIE